MTTLALNSIPLYQCPDCTRQYIDFDFSRHYHDYTDGAHAQGLSASATYTPYLCKCGNTLWWHELKCTSYASGEQIRDRSYQPRTPNFFQYLKIADASTDDRLKEVCARINGWQRGNDIRRPPLREHRKLNKRERNNLVRLHNLLDASDHWARLYKADIRRSLGYFEKAIKLLDSYPLFPEKSDEHARMAATRFLARQRTSSVVRINDALCQEREERKNMIDNY